MEWPEVGERIRECRLAAGLSQEELASKIGLERTMVAKIETGHRRLDALELGRLSAALGVPLDFFLQRRPQVLSRRAALVDPVTSDAAHESQQLEIALVAWVYEIRQLIELGVLGGESALMIYPHPTTGTDSARNAARWLRDRLGLGHGPIETVMAVSEKAGQLVLVTDLPGEGASLVDGNVAAAVVSREREPGRRRTTAAHELGHLVLGDEYSSDLGVATSREDRESVIDAFAAELLLPAEAITSHWGSHGSEPRDALIWLAATYRTSWSLAVRQACHAGVLTAAVARDWRTLNPTRAELMEAVGWAPQADLASVRVPPSVAHAVMEAWRRDLITSARAVELMHGQISIDDLPPREDSDLAP